MSEEREGVRVDKWLWAARFFKTRSLASEAAAGGKVEVNGERARPAKTVRVGDEVRVRLGVFEHVVVVRGLSGRRGPATAARGLYEETPESAAARAKLAERMRYEAVALVADAGRPTKKDRREIRRARGR